MAASHYLSRRTLWLNRLSEEVANGIVERVRSGDLAAGDPLPDRDALMAEFVTSAGVVDRAIETLVDEGLVTRDPGGALTVTGRARRPQALELPQTEDATRADVISIVELRIGIEAEAAALAAKRKSAAQLAGIREAQAAFESAAQAGAGAAQADFQFHLAISAASRNDYLRDLTEYLGPLLIPRMRIPLRPAQTRQQAPLDEARAEHAAIVEAIAAADPDAARRAMRQHLSRTLELVRGLGASS